MLNTYSTRIYNNRIYLPHLETRYRVHFRNLSFARQRCVARRNRQVQTTLCRLFHGSICTRETLGAGAPVGTRVWTRRKPRELSSTGSLVLMYIPSVGGKYWFYFADMTTICHQAPFPFVYTHTYTYTCAREMIPGPHVRLKRTFHGQRRVAQAGLAWGRVSSLVFARRYRLSIAKCFIKKHWVERKRTGR